MRTALGIGRLGAYLARWQSADVPLASLGADGSVASGRIKRLAADGFSAR